MTNRSSLVVAVLLAGLALMLAGPSARAQGSAKELRVKATYSGQGQVDAKSGIHLYLFDSPDFASGAVMPINMTSVHENGGVATFSGLTQKTVYMVAAYGGDELTMGPPPSGTPVAMYRPGDPSMPTPIAMEKDVVEVEFAFDDSFRIP